MHTILIRKHSGLRLNVSDYLLGIFRNAYFNYCWSADIKTFEFCILNKYKQNLLYFWVLHTSIIKYKKGRILAGVFLQSLRNTKNTKKGFPFLEKFIILLVQVGERLHEETEKFI